MSGKKRLLSLMLAVVMLISQFATMGAAADGVARTVVDDIYNETPSDADFLTSDDGLYSYRILEDDTVQIYEYLNCESTEVDVPEEIDGRTVTSIYDDAFSDHEELQEITLPDTLVHIGYNAFRCTGLYYSQMENSSDRSFYIGQYLVYANGDFEDEGYSALLNVKEGTTLIADGAISFYHATHLSASVAYIGNDNELGDHITYAGSEEDWEKISVFSSEITPDHFGTDSDVYTEKNRVEASCWKSGSYDWACTLCDFSVVAKIGMLDHTKGEKLLTIAPSCKTWGEGYSVYKCAICSSLFDADYVQEDKPHTKGAKIETVAPTCTYEGYTLYECAACKSVFQSDFTYSDRYNKGLGHEKGQLIKTVEPSCQNGGEGYYEYDCLHCEDYIHDYLYDENAAEHDYQLIESVKPSCLNEGEGYRYYVCSVCDRENYNYFWEEYEHNYQLVETVEPSCLNEGEGYRRYVCSDCEDSDYEYFWGDYEHEFVFAKTVAPTCCDYGYDLLECSLCGYETADEDSYVDPTRPDFGHEEDEFIKTILPSCATGGDGYDVYTCKHCDGEVYTNYNHDENVADHDYQLIESVEPSCENWGDGYDRYVCSGCGAEYIDWTYGDSKHNYQLTETEEPSCKNQGWGYEKYVCSVCDDYCDEIWGEWQHNYVYKERVIQTCETDGYNLYECTECKETRREDYIYAFGHVQGKLISEQKTANCLSPAYKEYYCLICKENYKEIEESDYIPHNFVNGTCKACKISANDVVESEHDYDDDLDKTWTITRKCDYLNITFSAYTYTENNYDYIYIYDAKDNLVGKYTGTELAGKTVKVMGGTAKIRLTSDGSETRYGFSTTKIAAVCNHTYNAGVVTKAATCTVNGVKTFTCTKCGATKTETVKASGHKEVALAAVAATYEKTGLTAGTKCSVCNAITAAQKVVAKLPQTSIKKAKVSVKDQTYTGKTLKPSVTVKLGNKTLKKGTDFTVTYKNNKNIGKATVTILGLGAYEGSVSKTFKINPKKLTGLKVKAGKKQMTVSWKKASVTGYEIVYATSKNFKKGKKTVTVKSAKTVKKVIKKLKAKKTYYVKVRAYKTVKKAKYYSAYTSAKKVKIKK